MTLGNVEAFHYREIEIGEIRPTQNIPSRIAEAVLCRKGERRPRLRGRGFASDYQVL